MEFPASAKHRVACLLWDPEAALRMHIMTRGKNEHMQIVARWLQDKCHY